MTEDLTDPYCPRCLTLLIRTIRYRRSAYGVTRYPYRLCGECGWCTWGRYNSAGQEVFNNWS